MASQLKSAIEKDPFHFGYELGLNMKSLLNPFEEDSLDWHECQQGFLKGRDEARSNEKLHHHLYVEYRGES